MELGMIGLGRMGANLVRRVQRSGHQGVVFDRDPNAVHALVEQGARGASTLAELVASMARPRHVWVMVPAGVVGSVVHEALQHLEPGDVLIDGGNSYWRDDIDRAANAAERGVGYLDVGTSGGVWGLERGFCLMVGGSPEAVATVAPIFDALAPGAGEIDRTPGRSGARAPEELGWLHCGGPGAGHFVKMIHNGIEYGMMAAFAEGLTVLKQAGSAIAERNDGADASASLPVPPDYTYNFDIAAITELWRRGSVVSSWLVDLAAAAFHESPELADFAGRVSDSGEGRWTVQAAIELGVPAPVITESLYSRFASRDEAAFANKTLSALRAQFGGHREQRG